MAWIESHSSMAHDPHVERVSRALTGSRTTNHHVAVGIVVSAWKWAVRADRLDAPFSAQELADGIGWSRSAHHLVVALVAGDFLAHDGTRWRLVPYRWIRVRGATLTGRRLWNRLRALVAPRVFHRDGAVCRACGTTERLTIDHIVPIARQGTHDLDNLQVLCQPCNSRKGVR